MREVEASVCEVVSGAGSSPWRRTQSLWQDACDSINGGISILDATYVQHLVHLVVVFHAARKKKPMPLCI